MHDVIADLKALRLHGMARSYARKLCMTNERAAYS